MLSLKARDIRRRRVRRMGIIFLPIFVILLAGCAKSKSYRSAAGMIWNTSYHLTFQGDPALADSALRVLDEVGKSLNVFDKYSFVSRINENSSFVVDDHFIKVYRASEKLNKASSGMFDPTLSPLINAWGFGKGHTITADTASVDSIMKFVGISKTRLNGQLLTKDDRRIQFNFSAIAKGYGCDKVAEMFRRNGVDNYLVEIGGEIAVGGKALGKNGWNISIDRPNEDGVPGQESQAVITITDCGMATSGNYRNFHKSNKGTFGHTISPLTGRPVTTNLLSATVIAPDCMQADGAATACMALGFDKAKSMLDSLGYDGMFVLQDSTVWISEGFRKLIKR